MAYIRRQREERDMTLTELARRLEISIAYLSRIERERERENPPPDHLISALAGALGLPPTTCSPRRDGCRRTCARAPTTSSLSTGNKPPGGVDDPPGDLSP